MSQDNHSRRHSGHERAGRPAGRLVVVLSIVGIAAVLFVFLGRAIRALAVQTDLSWTGTMCVRLYDGVLNNRWLVSIAVLVMQWVVIEIADASLKRTSARPARMA